MTKILLETVNLQKTYEHRNGIINLFDNVNIKIKQGDLIVVGSSFLSNSAEAIREFTAPFQGLYSTYRLYELISE